MNLQKLFDIQAKLDQRIVEEHGLEGQDLLDKKILALQVELGECANEWRGFKFWSKNQEPNKISNMKSGWGDAEKYRCLNCKVDFYGEPPFVCLECESPLIPLKREYPLLEEYVDCLHFVLSIGLELGETEPDIWIYKENDLVGQYIELINQAYHFHITSKVGKKVNSVFYESLLAYFLGLGEMLGFTEQQIYDAYMDKNKTNHTRQDTGY